MENTLFSQFADLIRKTDLTGVVDAATIPNQFLLARDGELSTHYIPFDVVNPKAKVVLVGITPGFTQWKNAMREAQCQLQAGATLESAQLAAKQTGAFSGAMRPNLINLLDAIGLQRWLHIDSCATLFGAHADLIQTTSILRHPVFVNDENYNGTPNMIKTPALNRQILGYFAQEIRQLSNAVYIPLGPKVSEGLSWLAKQGLLDEDRILHGLPHPSGANAERIAYFLGRKDRATLSSKTNPDALDGMRAALRLKVASLA